jgi:hypothetical protein
MAESDFVLAEGPTGEVRLVPAHYINNPAFGFKLAPEVIQVHEPATPAVTKVYEPAKPENKKEARS